MFRFIFLISVFTLTQAFPSIRYAEISPFIVGGSDTKVGEFPFIVSLQFITTNSTWAHYCGGTIFSAFWVLTSATCVFEDDPTQNRVQYGVNEISNMPDAPNVVGMEELVWHDEFNYDTKFNDIGLIKVMNAIEFDHFDFKVKLPISSDYFPTGTQAWIAGFGRTESDAPLSPKLQKANYQIYNQQDCAALHEEGSINHSNICGGQSGSPIGQCNGDSGGPLLVDGVQIGIASWSTKPCGDPNHPGVFTAIMPFINWIKAKTGANMRMRFFMRVDG